MDAKSELFVFSSPSKYVQGKDVISQLGQFVSNLGSAPLIVADDIVWSIVEAKVAASFSETGLPLVRVGFERFATPQAVDALAETITADGHDVVVGIGGGSAIDTAKAAGHLAGIRWASVPTAASSDAPTSALSVIYTEDGEFIEYRFFPHNPDLVLIDTQLVANAPEKFLAAGIGDALATWIEARATLRGQGFAMAGGRPTNAASALARLSWDLLWENALPALDAVRSNVVTPALEKVVEANTLLSGLGFESGGLAAAHAIHNGLTAAPQTHGLTHGQKVNLGTVTQLVMEGAPTSEIEDFIVFTTKVGLPNSLAEVGLTTADLTELRAVAEAATVEGETIHNMPFPVSAELVVDALIAVETISHRVRAEHNLPAPELYVAHH
jgi:glycerol dehydrogenase